MTIYVFLGPTLPADQARAELPSAVFLPPVSQGDLYRVALRGPRAIGIVDGYFHRVPAIWHKEVLWAMSRGIHIYGSASMGALRAAELAEERGVTLYVPPFASCTDNAAMIAAAGWYQLDELGPSDPHFGAEPSLRFGQV